MLVSSVALLSTGGLLGQFASRAAVSAVNNGGRLDKVAKDITSREAFRDIALGEVANLSTAGLTYAAGLGNLAELAGAARYAGIFGQQVIRAGVTGVVRGQDAGEIAKSATLGGALGMMQHGIGDIGVTYGLKDGGLAKTAMHTGVGGILGGKAGAIGGVVAEQVSSYLPANSSSSGIVGLEASATTMAVGGKVEDMAVAQTTAMSGYEYNSMMHITRSVAILAAEEAAEVIGETAAGMLVKKVGDKLTQVAADLVLGMIIPVETGPQINSTPIIEPDNKPIGTPVYDGPQVGTNTTPDQSDLVKQLSSFPGYAPAPEWVTHPQLPGFGVYDGPQMNVLYNKQLLPGEGKVATHGELKKLEKRGDNLTPHHFPQAAYMEKYGVSRKEGIAIMMEQPTPGVGGKHRSTRTYGKSPSDLTTPREELYLDLMDIRNLYKKDGLYTPEIRSNLQQGVQEWKEFRPDLFLKSKQHE